MLPQETATHPRRVGGVDEFGEDLSQSHAPNKAQKAPIDCAKCRERDGIQGVATCSRWLLTDRNNEVA